MAGSLRVAQYLRMSTDHQQYSTENQAHAILRYATEQEMVIVRTYADHGKSGLSLEGRSGLQQLLNDARSPAVDFEAILVYDVSRWGRFQNPDQAASYEYELGTRGITIHYCAEQFSNDGSLAAALLKTVKRGMAGEYSRELSVKVWNGQKRLIESGFRQGGPAGYGLRRQLIDINGNFKQMLAPGQRKSLLTDRVILVPGPTHEIAVVNEIFELFVHCRFKEKRIAGILQNRGVETEMGSMWSRGPVHTILTNHKYIGWNVYNRHSFKLQKQRVKNPPESWVRNQGAFTPIVPIDIFEKAQEIIAERRGGYSDEKLLHLLRLFIEKNGHVNTDLINKAPGLPTTNTYLLRFGSLLRAYELIGWNPGRSFQHLDGNAKAKTHHAALIEGVTTALLNGGATVIGDTKQRLLRISNEYTLRVIVVPCRTTNKGFNKWTVRTAWKMRPDIVLAARLRPDNESILDYYIFPRSFIRAELHLRDVNPMSIEIFKSPDYSPLVTMSRRKSWSLPSRT